MSAVRRWSALLPAVGLVSVLSCASDRGGAATAAEIDPISETTHVVSDDASLWLLLRGDDRRAPAVIWLHGGPGGAETPLFRLYDRDLEQSFVMVYWDQRGAGRSYDPDADPARLTIAQHLIDLDRVVDFVREELGVDRVSLIGHSWGSALGLLYAKRHPDKVAAFVGVGQVVSSVDQQRLERSFALARAHADGDEEAVGQVESIGAPPYSADQERVLEKWVDRYGGTFHQRPSFFGAVVSATLRGYVRPWEIPTFIHANDVSLEAMAPELADLDLRRSVPSVDVPVLFALGRYDHHVDARLAADYFRSLDAPRKRLVWFEHSAHNVPFEEPERFVEVVRDFLEAVTGWSPDERSPL